jgi:dGTPase
MHKTQVFLAPEGDHFRTRLTHTLEVAQISKSIARGLMLNEDLTEAIALGHDLGHTPFGHNGEYFLAQVHPGGFKHNEQSLRVADVLETHAGKRGMNLTAEVRDGILNHTGSTKPITLEGRIVKISDRIAYINHDIDDALRSGVLDEEELPKASVDVLGHTTGNRIDRLVSDIIIMSDGKDDIIQSEDCAKAMSELREYMFQNVYYSTKVKKEAELDKIRFLIEQLYKHYKAHPEDMPKDYVKMIDEYGIEEMAKDQVAGMTDRYAIDTFETLYVPTGWNG